MQSTSTCTTHHHGACPKYPSVRQVEIGTGRFTNNSFMFDTYPRNGTQWFIGEYACTSTNDLNTLGDIPSGRLPYPTLEGSSAEAAFMTGFERNSDVVFASAYAPSFQHIRNYQWTPDIITYDASQMVKSTSYYVQQVRFAFEPWKHRLSCLLSYLLLRCSV